MAAGWPDAPIAVEDSMSDAHTTDDHDGPHEGPIKTPKQLILAVFFSFVVPIIAIILLVMYVVSDHRPAAGSDGLTPEAVARRIQPVGTVAVKDLSDPAALKSGAQVYGAQCAACHGAGLAGAPKLGDVAAWAPRLGQGYDMLLTSALKGKGAMGAQGGGDYTDLEIGRAVVHMTNQAGAQFDEPKAVASAASAAPNLAAAAATPAAVAAPVAPVAPVAATVAATPASAAVATVATGKVAASVAVPALYTQSCQTCHVAGVAGAPKLGDKLAWAPRLAQGIDGLTTSVMNGKGAMPAKGGSTASDAEIKAVVSYMVSTVK